MSHNLLYHAEPPASLTISGANGAATIEAGSAELFRGTLNGRLPLGGGAFGDVYYEQWVKPNGEVVEVATKYLRAVFMTKTQDTDDARLMKRMTREKAVWERLDHPNVLPLLAYKPGKQPMLVSPYCRNGSLRHYVSNTQLRFIQKLELVVQVAKGMAYLHSLNPQVCHGDLNPQNVVIGDAGEARICDLGLSPAYHLTTQGLSTSDCPLGTKYYRPYELIFDSQQTLAGDVYAFGSLVLKVLSGREPHRDVKKSHDLVTFTENEVMPDRAAHPELPATSPIWELLFRCWARSQAARPTMLEARQMLEDEYTKRLNAHIYDA